MENLPFYLGIAEILHFDLFVVVPMNTQYKTPLQLCTCLLSLYVGLVKERPKIYFVIEYVTRFGKTCLNVRIFFPSDAHHST